MSRSERVRNAVSNRLRLIGWLRFFSSPEDRGVGSTILRLLHSSKSSPIKSELRSLLELVNCKTRIAVQLLDQRFPNPRCSSPRNYFTEPGDVLNFYLVQFGVIIDQPCDCSTWLDIMNAWGWETCKEKQSQIRYWLRQEALIRNLPFSDATATKLIKKFLNRT